MSSYLFLLKIGNCHVLPSVRFFCEHFRARGPQEVIKGWLKNVSRHYNATADQFKRILKLSVKQFCSKGTLSYSVV